MRGAIAHMADKTPLFGVKLPDRLVSEKIGESEDGIQRSAQFVAHAGQKLTLEPCSPLHFLTARLQLTILLFNSPLRILCFGYIAQEGIKNVFVSNLNR